MVKFEYVITDPLGIHARPAGMLVKEAAAMSSKCTIQKGSRTADLKKIFSLMNLAVKKNDTITITVEGGNEEADAEVIRNFLMNNL